MTLATAFIRKVPNRSDRDELVFATDTTLTGGQRFDQGAKIFDLPRTDALFCFAGLSYYAYPLAIQLRAAIGSYERSADRRFPLQRAVQHASRIFEQSFQLIQHVPSDGLPVDAPATFLFGGFSWHDGAFRIWRISIDRVRKEFPFEEIQAPYAFVGSAPARIEAEERLVTLLGQREKDVRQIDMEPFEVVRDIIRSKKYDDIGGVPQLAKVYRHMNTAFFATLWPCADGQCRPHAFGRPLRDWETTHWPIFNPDTLHFKAERPHGK